MRRLVYACLVIMLMSATGCSVSSAKPHPAPGAKAWTTLRVVVHKKNSPHSARVMVIQKNVPVHVLQCGNGWCHVRHGNRTGWVRASELTWKRT